MTGSVFKMIEWGEGLAPKATNKLTAETKGLESSYGKPALNFYLFIVSDRCEIKALNTITTKNTIRKATTAIPWANHAAIIINAHPARDKQGIKIRLKKLSPLLFTINIIKIGTYKA